MNATGTGIIFRNNRPQHVNMQKTIQVCMLTFKKGGSHGNSQAIQARKTVVGTGHLFKLVKQLHDKTLYHLQCLVTL